VSGFLGSAAPQPQQTYGQQGADLAEVGREVEVKLTVVLGGSGLRHRFRGLDRLPVAR
jgi:hypothetical protein